MLTVKILPVVEAASIEVSASSQTISHDNTSIRSNSSAINKFMKKPSVKVESSNEVKELTSPENNSSTTVNKEAVRSKFMKKPSQFVKSVNLTTDIKVPTFSPRSDAVLDSVASSIIPESITNSLNAPKNLNTESVKALPIEVSEMPNNSELIASGSIIESNKVSPIKSVNVIAAPKLSELAAFSDDDDILIAPVKSEIAVSKTSVGNFIAAPKLSELTAFDDEVF